MSQDAKSFLGCAAVIMFLLALFLALFVSAAAFGEVFVFSKKADIVVEKARDLGVDAETITQVIKELAKD